MKGSGLHSDSGIQIVISENASQDIQDLLSRTVYGMKGGMQYRHKNSSERIKKLIHPKFVALRKSNRLLGTAGFMQRHSLNDRSITSYYVRYLSFIDQVRIKNASSKEKNSADTLKRKLNSSLQEKLNDSFKELLKEKNEPAIFYAYVDKDNEYSQNFCKRNGFEKIRKLSTIVFSRISPGKNPAVSRLENDDQKLWVLNRLEKEYQNHSFYFTDHIFWDNDYFIYKENEKILAGIKATSVEWEILNIPGITGFIIKFLLPKTPFLSRLFNPKTMRFAAFEAAWCENGCEKQMIKLMESVCAELNLNMGIIWLDSDSELCMKLNSIGGLGILNRLKNDTPADIMAKFFNMKVEEIQKYKNRPVYISALDLS